MNDTTHSPTAAAPPVTVQEPRPAQVIPGPRRLARWRAALIVLVLLALIGALAWYWQDRRTTAAQPRYATEPATRGNLTVKVTANGTLQPTNKVDVGSELSGTVARVLVDLNDRVRQGQVLAELDTSKLKDQVARSRAALGVAQAALRQAQATVAEAAGNLQRLQEVRRLSGGKVPSESELATAQAALLRAQATVASGEAGVADARAALSVDETSLRKASIRAPITGVVLARSVDPGNAVAASLQAVTLFTLAEDLRRMKLAVNVDEADVGLVQPGQQASFNVSAYPARSYPATVTRVSYGATTKDNVVTYVAELAVDNTDESLRPGMTATASIVATERHDVLLVPNAALRFTPQAQAQAPADNGGFVSKLVPRPPARAPRRVTTNAAAVRQVWVLENGQPVPVGVVPGVSDGRMTEVGSDTLRPGMAVITGQVKGAS